MDLCNKHRIQMYRSEEINDRTIYDKNEIIKYETYAEIILYNKKCEECGRTIIDIDDIDKVIGHKWSMDKRGYVDTKESPRRLHRFIMEPPKDMEVDHINHNKLDNRKSNLRIVTRSQNNMNHKLCSRNTSGYKGVSYLKKNKVWETYIQVNGEMLKLGYFKKLQDAISARREAEIKYFGEFRYEEVING